MPVRRPSRLAVTLAATLLVAVAGCAPGAGDDERRLTVLAAASLTEVYTDLADRFEEEHPGVEVTLNFGSSTTLAGQAVGGAPGDVLATADRTAMQLAVDGGALSAEPVQFATNQLVLVVPGENPAGITGFTDDGFAWTDTTWVRCADDVPCGRVAVDVLSHHGITAEPASLEVDVKAVLTKVVENEADAGLVYATDARSAGDAVHAYAIPGAEQYANSYLIAPLVPADDDALAREWIALVQSPEGRTVLHDAGFGTG